ncbi:Amylo-alpha-1,6-glucosidase protein [Dioscorea alata]|uniref:Amylo-alpha-1,6-glucosidase protein n=1 Tax=Dioscorea alata TaxID=55571 RepID=A0ACB7UCU3_DIOAL|nr:Amylo-alpha-1,6-glucosidase protein [Dioscorea alata]
MTIANPPLLMTPHPSPTSRPPSLAPSSISVAPCYPSSNGAPPRTPLGSPLIVLFAAPPSLRSPSFSAPSTPSPTISPRPSPPAPMPPLIPPPCPSTSHFENGTLPST